MTRSRNRKETQCLTIGSRRRVTTRCGRASASTGPRKLRNALVIANVAIALVLLLSAGLLLRSLGELLRVDPGFDSRNVLTANLDVAGPNYKKDPQFVAFYERALRLRGREAVVLDQDCVARGLFLMAQHLSKTGATV